VRHSLRHTAATWLMQAGVEQLEVDYGHHHSDFQEEVAEAFSGRRQTGSLVAASEANMFRQ